jgi:hypothetical protein
MFLSHSSLGRLPLTRGLALAATALLGTALPAAAQQPGSKMWPGNVQSPSQFWYAPRSAAPAVSTARPAAVASTQPVRAPLLAPFQIVVTVPAGPSTELIALRGPSGQLQRFPLEGGRGAITARSVTVYPGERLTIRVTPAAVARRSGE